MDWNLRLGLIGGAGAWINSIAAAKISGLTGEEVYQAIRDGEFETNLKPGVDPEDVAILRIETWSFMTFLEGRTRMEIARVAELLDEIRTFQQQNQFMFAQLVVKLGMIQRVASTERPERQLAHK